MTGQAPESRNMMAQGAIVLAVCVGGYMALVDGPRQKAAQAEGECEAITTQLREAEALRDQIPMYTASRERCKAEAKTLTDAGRLAREERDLFSAIMSIADASHVTVDQLNPAKAPVKATGAVGQAEAADAHDITVAYSINASGTYPAMAVFLRSLRTGLGHSLVRSARFVPSPDDRTPIVRAVIETEHYSFDPTPPAQPEAVRSTAAGGN